MAAECEAVTINAKPVVSILSAATLFNRLSERKKLYSHHLARAAWSGTRVILEQVSQESPAIFDFILEVHAACRGDHSSLAKHYNLQHDELSSFLNFAAVFLGNIGNYYSHGDQKFVPNISSDFLIRLSKITAKASELHEKLEKHILSKSPSSLGFPSSVAQSAYYFGDPYITKDELDSLSSILDQHSVEPENTRIRRTRSQGQDIYDILQASVERDAEPIILEQTASRVIRIIRGDHATALRALCDHLRQARAYALNDVQRDVIDQYLSSFETGRMEPYKESQRLWVKDAQPAIESVFGFVEPYRDPYGVRAEFEGLTAIVNIEETQRLTELVKSASKYIRRMPWATGHTENQHKGPFEKELFDDPDFTSLHTIAYCSSIIFPGVNLPNYNDIRQKCGFKNVMIQNSMAESAAAGDTFVESSEEELFLKHKPSAFYLWVVFHELLGHGTSKLLAEESPGVFNFDVDGPPLNPLTGVFGDLATSVDECRAECVGAYLLSDRELLTMFGFTGASDITADDLEYNMYLQLGTAGLRALRNYSAQDQKWGQAHSRAHFAMFRTLLGCSSTFLKIHRGSLASGLTATIDRAQIATHARPALGDLLLRLHIFRCIADVTGCREFYESLTTVDGEYIEWREIVVAQRPPDRVFVQPNTYIDDEGRVQLREYEESVEGMIRSWAERGV